MAPVLDFQTGSSGGGLLGGGDGSCCGSLLRYKQELQALDFLFWTGDGSGLLGCYVGDSLLVFPSAVRGDGGSFFKRGDGDGAAAVSGAAMAAALSAVASSAQRLQYLSLWRTLSVPSRMCKSRRSRSSGCCSNACFISNSC